MHVKGRVNVHSNDIINFMQEQLASFRFSAFILFRSLTKLQLFVKEFGLSRPFGGRGLIASMISENHCWFMHLVSCISSAPCRSSGYLQSVFTVADRDKCAACTKHAACKKTNAKRKHCKYWNEVHIRKRCKSSLTVEMLLAFRGSAELWPEREAMASVTRDTGWRSNFREVPIFRVQRLIQKSSWTGRERLH